MPQFTISPQTAIIAEVSFIPNVDIQVNSIQNIHALELTFGVNDIISANTKVNILEGYASMGFTPKVVVDYTEI